MKPNPFNYLSSNIVIKHKLEMLLSFYIFYGKRREFVECIPASTMKHVFLFLFSIFVVLAANAGLVLMRKIHWNKYIRPSFSRVFSPQYLKSWLSLV